MKYDEIMVRYGELSTKGKNKKYFINKLARNVRDVLHDLPQASVQANHDRMRIYLNGEDDQAVIERLRPIFGIQTFSPVVKIEKDIRLAEQTAADLVESVYKSGMSFKINTRRSDHTFEQDTNEVNRLLGESVTERLPGIDVKMKEPDITVRVEIRDTGIFLSVETIEGAGGLPVGTGGRAMLMLSGGIDSPVAGYLAMKRGMEIEAVHFHSPPYTSPQALQKAKDLTSKLAAYTGRIQFVEVPFTEIQEEIKRTVPEGYWMTVTRRMMLRITDRIRADRSGLAIVNGESLGQVASQTLESMVAINEVTNTPVLRPLVSLDKTEIIEIARHIDTFDLSIEPFEDCCTIFAPPKPKTRPKIVSVQSFEQAMDLAGLIERAISGIRISEIKVGEGSLQKQEEEFSYFL